jgi:hypothetical protein
MCRRLRVIDLHCKSITSKNKLKESTCRCETPARTVSALPDSGCTQRAEHISMAALIASVQARVSSTAACP